MMTEERLQALDREAYAGAVACVNGFPPSACPHGPDCEPEDCVNALHYAWLVGWWKAFFAAQEQTDLDALDAEVEAFKQGETADESASGKMVGQIKKRVLVIPVPVSGQVH